MYDSDMTPDAVIKVDESEFGHMIGSWYSVGPRFLLGKDPISVAKSGLTAVASCTFALLLCSSTMDKMTPESVQVAESTEKKTLQSLVGNLGFVTKQGLPMEPVLLEKVKAVINKCAARADVEVVDVQPAQ